jgi:hypothetical protein
VVLYAAPTVGKRADYLARRNFIVLNDPGYLAFAKPLCA